MTVFILSKEEKDSRVILDVRNHGIELGAIEADAVTEMANGYERIICSAWKVARELVDESKFFHIENHGWFSRTK